MQPDRVPRLFIAAAVLAAGAALPALQSPGNSGFAAHTVDGSGPVNPWAKIAGDLDGDGLTDLVIAGQKGPLVWYRAPKWTRHLIAEGGYQTVTGAAGDIDGDGDLDIVLGGTVWFENPGNLRLAADGRWNVHRVADHPTHDALVADFDGDSRLDIVTRNQSDFGAKAGHEIHIWMQERGRTWRHIKLDCPHGEGIAVADLDMDGDDDIVTGGTWFETIRAGANTRWSGHRFANWHPSASIAVGDINKDNRPDVILAPSELAKQEYRLSWWESPEDPRHDRWREHIVANPVECVIHGVQAADIDLDGNLDIVFAEMHQGRDPDEVGFYLNRGPGRAWDKHVVATTGSHAIQILDVDSDGDIDLFGANWSGPFQPVQLWINQKRLPGASGPKPGRSQHRIPGL